MEANGAKRLKAGLCVLIGGGMCTGVLAPRAEADGCPPDRTYTLNADFDAGTLINVNHDIDDQLQLNEDVVPNPFIWVAASARGTAVRIHTKTGEILGEYRTAPETAAFPNPSRTTVDLLGNCWVGNRGVGGVCDGVDKGSVVRIGLIIGGTRVDAGGSPAAGGGYLAPPYDYNTCEDQDNDGLIKTSRGLADIRPWPNGAGADTCPGDVSTAEDECIINYTRVTGTGTRAMAIGADNDLMVGGLFNAEHERVDGVTGQPIPNTQFNLGCGGYGGLYDLNGVFWSARAPLLRYVPDPNPPPHGVGQCINAVPGAYGLGLDPNTGNVWVSELGGSNHVHELNPADGSVLATYPQGFGAQGVAVDGNSHVWVAELFGSQVLHLAPDPSNVPFHYEVGKVSGFGGTTGVAVDANGKVWATEIYSNSVSRIDPLGGAGPDFAGNFVGAIELTVDLGAGAGPYNYSDQTGIVALVGAANGTWTVVRDGGKDGTEWGTVTWNTEGCAAPSEPPGTSLTVEVRASDTEAGLPSDVFVEVENGVKFAGIFGGFIEIRVTFSGVSDPFATPVLCDLTVDPQCPGGACCDHDDGTCTDDVLQGDCQGGQLEWTKDTPCTAAMCVQHTGACCQGTTGVCDENVLPGDCMGDQDEWFKNTSCSAVSCQEHTGACCVEGVCTDAVPQSACASAKWFKDTPCDDPAVVQVCERQRIPVVSEWGVVIMTLLLLVGAKVYFGRRRSAQA